MAYVSMRLFLFTPTTACANDTPLGCWIQLSGAGFRSHFNHLKTGGDARGFGQHDAGRAVFVVAHGDGALDRAGGQATAFDGEVHVNLGEHLGVGASALAGEFDAATLHRMAPALEDEHHVICRAAAGTGKHRLHGARRQVAAAVLGLGRVGRAVHGQHVAAAGFSDKAHGRLAPCVAGPGDGAFHV